MQYIVKIIKKGCLIFKEMMRCYIKLHTHTLHYILKKIRYKNIQGSYFDLLSFILKTEKKINKRTIINIKNIIYINKYKSFS